MRFHIFHRYGKWIDSQYGSYQFKRCEICNKAKTRVA